MSLKDRLNRLTEDRVKPATTAADPLQERIAELRRKLDRAMERRSHGAPATPAPGRRFATPLEDVVDGEEARTPLGTFFVSRSRLKGGDFHGNARICDVASASVEAVAFLTGAGTARGMSLTDGLFLDTETTGLAGGTGTFPFLIGLGWFEASSFVTCQLFARDFSEEGAMLARLSEIAADKRFLVTFNGKAFDLNLLATRFVLNRCPDTLSAMPHIDLLHPSRRALGHRLENARLATIEAEVLGVEREGDVPGFEIPQRYFDWLRRRDGHAVGDVFMHNRLDVISMAALLKYLADLAEDGREAGHCHHGDVLGIAGLVHERGDYEKACRMLEGLISSHHTDVAAAARRSLSLIYKKTHHREEAVSLWQSLVEADSRDYFAVEELAKYYEHHTHEYEKASRLVGRFLEESVGLDDGERASAEYRLRRLLRRAPKE